MRIGIELIASKTIDLMPVWVYESNAILGERASADFTMLVSRIVKEQGSASVIFATGNSQLSFINSLRARVGTPWNKVSIFHMDEYRGMSPQHPASLARWIRERLVDSVHPASFYQISGDCSNIDFELTRYADLLRKHPPDICALGIGENGHLAFNDPPVDFETKQTIHVVTLDVKCRLQQVGEGHFPILNDVPKQAITLTVPALLSAKHVLAVVPEARKAEAVKAALQGPVTPDCPASILRTHSHVTLFLDRESASLLDWAERD